MIVIWRVAVVIYMLMMGMTPASGKSFEEGNVEPNNARMSERKDRTRWGRDPFYRERPVEMIGSKTETGKESGKVLEPETSDEKPAPLDNLSLAAIIFRGGSSAAIINDRIVRAGDTIKEGFLVSDILTDKVILLAGERVVVLRVQPFGRK